MRINRSLCDPRTYVVACTILFANSLSATAIGVGQANIDGSVTVTATTISFFNNSGVTPNIFNVDTGSGSFAGLTTPDSIMNLSGGPVTGNTSVMDFASFTATPGLIFFDLSHIDPGTGTLAACSSNTVGNVCTPAGSPFTLSQVTPTTVAFTLSLEGWFYTGVSSTGETLGQGLFTGQQVPGTITGILATLSSVGSISNSYSATFSTLPPVPEPGTLASFLIGAGLLAMGVYRRRRHPSKEHAQAMAAERG
jgi:hypothetical protein